MTETSEATVKLNNQDIKDISENEFNVKEYNYNKLFKEIKSMNKIIKSKDVKESIIIKDNNIKRKRSAK